MSAVVGAFFSELAKLVFFVAVAAAGIFCGKNWKKKKDIEKSDADQNSQEA